jgi:hypothetical protein
MKYIKLFEAFESEMLTKTLGYINKSSRSTVINILNRICKKIDFPQSKLSDELFKYLPYKSAVDLKPDTNKPICRAESISAFSRGAGIRGEFCNSGRIKRNWGAGTRIVECPECKGTGFEKSLLTNIVLYKFWFNKDGQYQGITGCGESGENKLLHFDWRENISLQNNRRELESILSGAHFAIILDAEKLKNSEYKRKSQIISNREELKSGSLLTVKPNEVRKANLNRYMKEIAKRTGIMEDANNLKKIVVRFLGGNYSLIHLMRNPDLEIDYLISHYKEALRHENEVDNLLNFIGSRYSAISDQNKIIEDNLKFLRKMEIEPDKLEIIDYVEKISKTLHERVLLMDFDSIEDLEFFIRKSRALKGLFESGGYDLDYLVRFFSSLTLSDTNNVKYYFFDDYSMKSRHNTIKYGLPRALKVARRY